MELIKTTQKDLIQGSITVVLPLLVSLFISRFGVGFFAGTGVFTFFFLALFFGVHGTSTGRKNDLRITSFLGSV